MSTLHTSEKTNQGMLPQSPALESTSADKPGVGTKRDVETVADAAVAGVQHGRGETSQTVTSDKKRHSVRLASAGRTEDRGRKTSCNITAPKQTQQYVFVLDKNGQPLQPCQPARAGKLLANGRARVHHLVPFVIRLVDREVIDSKISGVDICIDPGSKTTGLSVFTTNQDGRKELVSIEIEHRGQMIHKKMQQRANYRRRRRSANLRYRAPRFNSRTKPRGCLAPSLKHRVDSTTAMIKCVRRWTPVTAIHQELVRFNIQKMQNPEISGVEYQQGELAGYEVREYLLSKFNRTCAYCGASDTPLNIDHIHPRASGGSNHVSNLALACIPCNQSKNDLPVEKWLASKYGDDKGAVIAEKVLARAKSPLRDAAAVDSTRWALHQELQNSGLPVFVSSGRRSKWNRHRFNVAKSHSLDALCVGEVDGVISYPDQVLVAKAAGRGSYSRTRPDAYGFPRLAMPRTKSVHGFQTGDLVRALVPRGKNTGVHVGRVAVRTSAPAHKFVEYITHAAVRLAS
jgi:5-methylcytosine-specific restriction endonuclease McrA